jgi:hypothetical protein
MRKIELPTGSKPDATRAVMPSSVSLPMIFSMAMQLSFQRGGAARQADRPHSVPSTPPPHGDGAYVPADRKRGIDDQR